MVARKYVVNVKLLAGLIVGAVLVAGTIHGIHILQVGRSASKVESQLESARTKTNEAEEPQQRKKRLRAELRLLSNYLAMRPEDAKRVARLAMVRDELVGSEDDVANVAMLCTRALRQSSALEELEVIDLRRRLATAYVVLERFAEADLLLGGIDIESGEAQSKKDRPLLAVFPGDAQLWRLRALCYVGMAGAELNSERRAEHLRNAAPAYLKAFELGPNDLSTFDPYQLVSKGRRQRERIDLHRSVYEELAVLYRSQPGAFASVDGEPPAKLADDVIAQMVEKNPASLYAHFAAYRYHQSYGAETSILREHLANALEFGEREEKFEARRDDELYKMSLLAAASEALTPVGAQPKPDDASLSEAERHIAEGLKRYALPWEFRALAIRLALLRDDVGRAQQTVAEFSQLGAEAGLAKQFYQAAFEAFVDAGNSAVARGLLDSDLKGVEETPALLLAKGRLELLEGNPGTAVGFLGKVRGPQVAAELRARAHFLLGQCREQLYQFDLVEGEYEAALGLDGDWPAPSVALARWHMRRGNWSDAVRLFEFVKDRLHALPAEAGSEMLLAAMYAQARAGSSPPQQSLPSAADLQEVEARFNEQLRRVGPENLTGAEQVRLRGRFYVMAGAAEAAVAVLERGVADFPNDMELRLGLAFAHRSKADSQDAEEEVLRGAVAAFPSSMRARILLAAHLALPRGEGANAMKRAEAEQLLWGDINGFDPEQQQELLEAWGQIAGRVASSDAALAREYREKAKRAFERVSTLAPGSLAPLLQRLEMAMQDGDIEAVKTLSKEIRSRNLDEPSQPIGTFCDAWVLLQSRQFLFDADWDANRPLQEVTADGATRELFAQHGVELAEGARIRRVSQGPWLIRDELACPRCSGEKQLSGAEVCSVCDGSGKAMRTHMVVGSAAGRARVFRVLPPLRDRLAQAGGSTDALRSDLERLRRARPRWSVTWRLLGQLEEQLGDTNAAIAAYREQLKLAEIDRTATVRLALLLGAADRKAEARDVLARLDSVQTRSGTLERYLADALGLDTSSDEPGAVEQSDDPLVHLTRGLKLLRDAEEGDMDAWGKAEASLLRARDLDDQSTDVWQSLVRLYQGKDPAKARNTIAQAESRLTGPNRWWTLAQCCIQIKDREAALRYFEQGREEQPSDVRFWRGAAVLTPDKNQAVTYLEKALTSPGLDNEDTANLRRILALIYGERGKRADWEKAIKLVDQNLSMQLAASTQTKDLRTKAILLSTRRGKPYRDEAIKALEDGLALGHATSDDRHLLAKLYYAGGETRKGREQMLRVVGSERSNPQYLASFVDILLRSDRVSDAQNWLNQLERMDGDNPTTVKLRARWYHSSGRDDEAVRTIEALADEHATPEFLSELAGLLEQLEQNAAADKMLLRLLKVAPNDATSYRQRALWLARQSRVQEALDLVRSAPATNADELAESLDIALRVVMIGDPTELELSFVDRWVTETIRSNPGNANYLRVIQGNLWIVQRRYAEAHDLFMQLLGAAQADAMASIKLISLNNLAWVLSEGLDRAGEAEKFIALAIEEFEPIDDLLDTRLVVLTRLGERKRLEKAVRDMEGVVEQNPRPVFNYHLARAYYLLGASQSASEAIARVDEAGGERQIPFTERADYETFAAKVRQAASEISQVGRVGR